MINLTKTFHKVFVVSKWDDSFFLKRKWKAPKQEMPARNGCLPFAVFGASWQRMCPHLVIEFGLWGCGGGAILRQNAMRFSLLSSHFAQILDQSTKFSTSTFLKWYMYIENGFMVSCQSRRFEMICWSLLIH